jgi:cytochrome c-type biogenesis protein CcmE
MDVTPRPVPSRRPRRWWASFVVVAVIAGLAFVATKALGDATLFFYNADEAVTKRVELADKRFRLQGTVVGESIVDTGDGVEFAVTYNGTDVQIVHRGDPPQMFQADMPVVLEGRWDRSSDVFSSDRMLVKHDEKYDAEHPERATTTSTSLRLVP